jgi:hypothetical protein
VKDRRCPSYLSHIAGHYVPALAERILEGNKKRSGIDINMQGLAIGYLQLLFGGVLMILKVVIVLEME